MKNKRKGLLSLIIIVAVIIFCGYTAVLGLGKDHKGSAQDIRLGLDLAGGVSITYEAAKENPTDTEMKDTLKKMQQRAEVYSTESNVVQEGSRRVVIDIPGAKDAEEVLQGLGKEGTLAFVAQKDITQNEDGTVSYDKKDIICSGSEVKRAEASTQQNETTRNREHGVDLVFNTKGTKRFAKATEEAVSSTDNKLIYIVYDNEVLSNPSVSTAITNGEARISGNFKTYEEAEKLASSIRIGALPLELKEIQSQVVGAQLGLDAINSSLMAGAIGFALVILFMIVFYRLPGLAASIALLFYIVVMIVVLNVLNVTLTLPGVAGILLNIGMAVDANVIIFTRIKEELAKGKSVQSSIKLGFDKALSAIVDGNVTTLIAAAVLYLKGSGTIRGFATTLTIGILLSMFTALYITRVILNAMYVLGVDDKKYFGVEKQRERIAFVGNRVKFFVASGIMVVACVACLLVNKGGRVGYILNYGLDFLGGTTYSITFDDSQKVNDDIKKQVESIFSDVSGSNDVVISDVAGSNQLSVKAIEMTEDQRNELTNTLIDKFDVQEGNIQYESISAAVSDEMRADAIVAVVIATICMLLYIWLRFKDIVFAGSAVLALLHDVVFVLLIYAVSLISVGNTFIACMLTIVGYSINATIVIFDRIRENLGGRKSPDALAEVVDNSITQTLSRSINTSITTIIMVLVLAIFGVESVRDFAIPLMGGFICGAYSSVCITGTLWFVLKHGRNAKSTN